MSQGNQLGFKSINESVEKYAVVGEDWRWDLDNENADVKISDGEIILGLYNDMKSLKSSLKWHHLDRYLSNKIKKVKITIEELEEIIL